MVTESVAEAEVRLRSLAARWWPSQGGDRAYDRVFDIVDRRHELVPPLLRALVATAPQGGARYLGTAIVEDLINFPGGSNPIDLVLSADLPPAVVFEIFSGVYVDLLERCHARVGLAGTLSPEQIDWLMDNEAPHRWAQDGTMVADGDSVRFAEGQTEWERLYYSAPGNGPVES